MEPTEREPELRGLFGKPKTITDRGNIHELHATQDKLADQWRALYRDLASIGEQRRELHEQYSEALHQLTELREATAAKLQQTAVAIKAEHDKRNLPGWRLSHDDIAAMIAQAEGEDTDNG